MNSRRNPMSEYLADQGKRTHLLDYLVSTQTICYQLSTVLLDLDASDINEVERQRLSLLACTLAMDLLGDWAIAHPMLTSIYDDVSDV